MVTFASQRGQKAEEAANFGANLIGTLTINDVGAAGPGVFVAGPNEPPGLTLAQILRTNAANGHKPLLWAFSATHTGGVVKFGYDRQVLSLAVGAGPLDLAKIGHVALMNNATISGEISQAGASWTIDNNSGAWGSMGNNSGKSQMLNFVAQIITNHDPGGIQVTSKRAYSRTGWKRAVQQVFR